MGTRSATYVVVVAIGAALAGCGSSSKSSSHPHKSPGVGETAAAQVTTVWTRFFSGRTPAAVKVSLLENGQKFAPVIEAQSKSPLAAESSVKVSNVKLTGTSSAAVTYTVLLAGKPALKNTTGTAVKAGSSWKVSEASFCQLLALQGTKPPGCPKA